MSIHKFKGTLQLNHLKLKIKARRLAPIQHFAIMFRQIKYHLHSNIQYKIISNFVVHLSLRIITKTKIVMGQWIITHIVPKMMFTLLTIHLFHLITTMDILLILCKWILLTIILDLVTSHHNFNIQDLEITMDNFKIVIITIISLDLASRNLTIKIIQIIVSIHRIIINSILNHIREHLCKRNKNQKLRIQIHKNQSKILSYNKMVPNQMVW